MRTCARPALLVVGLLVASCSDDLATAPESTSPPPTSTTTSETSMPAVAATTPMTSTSVAATTSTATPEEPVGIVVDFDGPPASCATAVQLYDSVRQDNLFASLPGDVVLDVASFGEDTAILTRCGDLFLAGRSIWTDNGRTFPNFVLVDNEQGSSLDWNTGQLLFVEHDPFVSDADISIPLSDGDSLRLSLDRTNNLVANSCGEHHLAFGLYVKGQDGTRVPWRAEDGAHLAPHWIEDSVANVDGEFAIIESVCTDDGSWSTLILGSYDPSSGALIEFRRLEGFTARSESHRGPLGLSLDDDTNIVVHVGVESPTKLRVDDFCSNAKPLRAGGADWALYEGGTADLRRQLHRCEAGQLLASAVVDTEGVVFWAADSNGDGVEEVFVGGTASSSGGGSAWTLADGRLVAIWDDDYRQLGLWDGYRYFEYGDYGCIGDTYAQIVATREQLDDIVTLTQFHVAGHRATIVNSEVVTIEGGALFETDGFYNDEPLPFADRLENCT